MHITSLSYQNKKLFQFTKLLNSGNKESNQWLIDLDIVTFYDKDKKKPSKINLDNLKLGWIQKNQAKA